MDQQHLAGLAVLHDGRRAGHGVAGRVVGELLVPHHLAGVLVQRHDAGVEGAEVDLVAIDGGAAVDHVAARADVVGPQALAGLGVEGEHAGIGTGDVDHPVVDDGLRLLAALFLVAERVRPGRGQLEHVLVVDLGQRAPALGVGAQSVLQHVAGGLVVVGDVVPGHRFGEGAAGRHQGEAEDQALHGARQRGGGAGECCSCHVCGSHEVGGHEVFRGVAVRRPGATDSGSGEGAGDTEKLPPCAGKIPEPDMTWHCCERAPDGVLAGYYQGRRGWPPKQHSGAPEGLPKMRQRADYKRLPCPASR
ncbi:hypothetical protein D9M69_290600 [compost metagenome]